MITITSHKTRTDAEPCETEIGYCCVITGTHNGEAFTANVWCEYDGRDVEIEMVSGPDITEDMDFFVKVCEFPGFEEGMAQGYAQYEANM